MFGIIWFGVMFYVIGILIAGLYRLDDIQRFGRWPVWIDRFDICDWIATFASWLYLIKRFLVDRGRLEREKMEYFKNGGGLRPKP